MTPFYVVGFVSGLVGAVVGVLATVLLGIVPPGHFANDSLRIIDAVNGTKLEHLPVRMGLRSTRGNNPLVFELLNTSGNPIKNVKIIVEDPDNFTLKRIERAEWPPNGMITVGENDGWTVALRQTIAIEAPGYLSGSVTLK
jgi:hypothetical protein